MSSLHTVLIAPSNPEQLSGHKGQVDQLSVCVCVVSMFLIRRSWAVFNATKRRGYLLCKYVAQELPIEVPQCMLYSTDHPAHLRTVLAKLEEVPVMAYVICVCVLLT